jgi:hypothetical protein
MNEKEKAFFEWYEKIEAYKDNYNLRQAFDAGYDASRIPQTELGRVSEATIMNTLSKAMADGKVTRLAFDALRYKIQAESDIRKDITTKIRVRLLPVCVCEKCENVHDSRLLEEVIKLILEGN